MSRCLNERTLFLLSEGEGRAPERAHVAWCARCAARYERVVRASELAARVLREEPPPLPRRPSVPARWLMPVAAAALLVLTLVWHGAVVRPPAEPVVFNGKRTEVALASGQHRSAPNPVVLARASDVFSAIDGDVAPDRDSDGTYLEAALGGEWPCEGQEQFADPRCY